MAHEPCSTLPTAPSNAKLLDARRWNRNYRFPTVGNATSRRDGISREEAHQYQHKMRCVTF